VKAAVVVGARPNFMKAAPLIREFANRPGLRCVLIHTGQHYDENMSRVFFEDLELPAPDIHLGVGSGSHAEQTGKIMIAFEGIVARERPDLIIVVGDVNSTLACSLVGAKALVPVAHVEAGLRSFDLAMPEEINRMVTDILSSFCFTTSPEAETNLLREGVRPERIFFVGNIMIDSLLFYLERSERSRVIEDLGLAPGSYVLVTLHRPSNVDRPDVFGGIMGALAGIAQQELHLNTATEPGAGAAGGLGFGLRTFLGAKLKPGFELFAQLSQLTAHIEKADLILTGEGAIDEQTLMGKGVGELAALCHKMRKRCVGLAGIVTDAHKARQLFTDVHSMVAVTSADEAKANASHWLEEIARRAAQQAG